MEYIKALFGEGSLNYEEFARLLEESGRKFGDMTELEAAHKREVDHVRIDYAVERSLEKFGAKNGALVRKALDFNGIRVEDGCVTGVEEQMTALLASDPYLFRDRATVRTGGKHGVASPDSDSLSDAEYYRTRGLA